MESATCPQVHDVFVFTPKIKKWPLLWHFGLWQNGCCAQLSVRLDSYGARCVSRTDFGLVPQTMPRPSWSCSETRQKLNFALHRRAATVRKSVQNGRFICTPINAQQEKMWNFPTQPEEVRHAYGCARNSVSRKWTFQDQRGNGSRSPFLYLSCRAN